MENQDLHPPGIRDNSWIIPFPDLVPPPGMIFLNFSLPFLHLEPGILPAPRTQGESLPIP